MLTPPSVASDTDDGLLTATEAARLTLSADWVILSACNTASAENSGGGDSLSALARGFLYAGADALLAGSDAPDQGLWQEQMLGRSAGTVGGGTSEVHRNGLGERALGLPREARPDRHEAFKDLKTSGS